MGNCLGIIGEYLKGALLKTLKRIKLKGEKKKFEIGKVSILILGWEKE